MLAPIFQDPSFNLEWMARNRKMSDAIAQGTSSSGFQSYSATSETDQGKSSQTETPDAVTAGAEGSQAKSSTEKSESSKESKKEDEKSGELTPDQQREVSQLQTADRRVRAHEQAHLSAAQGIAVSGANFEYRVGPDDKRYAVAGEVSIDTSKESEPERTIIKGNQIIRAALAPADPSPQDHSVAASAAQMIQEAQAELMRNSYAQNQDSDEEDEDKAVGSNIDQQA